MSLCKYIHLKSFFIITIPILCIAAFQYKIMRVSSFEMTFKSPNISSQLYQKQEKQRERESRLYFATWLKRKNILKANVERVCKKYGKAISKNVDTKNIFMFDGEHNLLFCGNPKVIWFFANWRKKPNNHLLGRINILEEKFSLHIIKVSVTVTVTS